MLREITEVNVKIRMRTTAMGPGISIIAGKEGEVSRELGEALIEARYAEAVEPESKPKAKEPEAEKETTTAEPAENAMLETTKRRRVKKDE